MRLLLPQRAYHLNKQDRPSMGEGRIMMIPSVSYHIFKNTVQIAFNNFKYLHGKNYTAMEPGRGGE